MKSGKFFHAVLFLALCAGCGSGSSTPVVTPTPPPAPTTVNALAVTVNGSLCSPGSYPNKACVSVTVCTPGTTDCQTVNDILLDTGSAGLRIFKQVLTIPLTQVASSSGSLAECIQFADGTSGWGPVQMADVTLGNEPAVQVPVHVLDSTFATVPGSCGTPQSGPSAARYNGLLGVGIFAQDCGPTCVQSGLNNWYFSCTGTNCSGTNVLLAHQVQNPVALLPQDNNGVIIQLPAIPLGGAPFANGQLLFGIGTRSNNSPSGATAYPASSTGEFTTTFNGTSTPGFIDTGSNGLFMGNPSPSLPPCAAPNSGWFCPPATVSLTATNTGAGGSPSGVVPFQIGNAIALFSTTNKVFAELGGTLPVGFDWGLPFFYGRDVAIGIEGRSSSLGTGPYWAY
ncbi:MAG TPA: DUF3443 domain-containing protein [Geobacteraceae bacterium]